MKKIILGAFLVMPVSSFAMPHMSVDCLTKDKTIHLSVTAVTYSSNAILESVQLNFRGSDFAFNKDGGEKSVFLNQYWNDREMILMKASIPGEQFLVSGPGGKQYPAETADLIFRAHNNGKHEWVGELTIQAKLMYDSVPQVLEKIPAICFNNP